MLTLSEIQEGLRLCTTGLRIACLAGNRRWTVAWLAGFSQPAIELVLGFIVFRNRLKRIILRWLRGFVGGGIHCNLRLVSEYLEALVQKVRLKGKDTEARMVLNPAPRRSFWTDPPGESAISSQSTKALIFSSLIAS
jgi:hypothetical protein